MARNDLLVLSYVWYQWKKKKKRLYSRKRNQFFDFAGGEDNLERILYGINDFEVVEVELPCWKLATILNEQLVFQGDNPLGFESCPFVPVFWNYEPHINYYDLRVRSLVKTMRDPQFLLNRRIIINHDISEATINAGWKRKSGAVANEDNLKKSGQGWDIVINEGYELTDCEKIIPSEVPASDMELANQMADLIFKVSGINLESWNGDNTDRLSGLTLLLKQGANLMVLQKYFDQWDYSLKLLGDLLLKVALNNWEAGKIQFMLGEDPSPFFYSKIFAKYQTIVEEGLNTATQKNMQAQQLLEINQLFGREVFPPSLIIKDMNLFGRTEAIQYLQQQEARVAQQAAHVENLQNTMQHAQLQEMYAKAANQLAMARERHGRAEADIGLFEERLSEITHNRAMATKAKMEALEKLVDVIGKYGEIETALQMANIESFDYRQQTSEETEKKDAKSTAMSNDLSSRLMQSLLAANVQQSSGALNAQGGAA
jgi:hypothetical protein